ncbi:hypothetical protein MRX96_016960 [Rhipicephalus microplus]
MVSQGGGAAVPVELRRAKAQTNARSLYKQYMQTTNMRKCRRHTRTRLIANSVKTSRCHSNLYPQATCAPPGAGGDDPNSDIDGGPGSDSDTTDDDDWDTQEATHI